MSQSMDTMDACLVALCAKALELIAVAQVRRNETTTSRKSFGIIEHGALSRRANGELGILAALGPGVL